MKRVTVAILALVGILPTGSRLVRASQQVPSKQIIVPGVGIGDFKLGMSKDDVLKKMGKPKSIYLGNESYTLDNVPTRYRLLYGHIELEVDDNAVQMVRAHSPLYKFANGLGVGDSEDKIKQAFGEAFKFHRPERENGGNTARYHSPLPGPLVLPKIDRRPQPEDDTRHLDKGVELTVSGKDGTVEEITVYRREGMKSLPKYDRDSGEVLGLRGCDASKLDLRDSFEDLMYVEFDHRTVWPPRDKMPSGFDPQRIMELGKNPGLGIRSLHKEGITGRGVRIAILDKPLLVDHQEYADRVQLYEEINIKHHTRSQSHGCMTASVALGKTVGVAPEAELFFIGLSNFDREKKGARTLRYLAAGIHRIVEINEQLPQDKKIRAISISKGWLESHEGYDLIMEAVQKARAAGMLVICCAAELVYEGCDLGGLGRSPLADPDILESYGPTVSVANSQRFWAYDDSLSEDPGYTFRVPLDSRTTASQTGIDEYVFDRGGGSSKAPPYIAGLYALAVQVDPAITSERFWVLAAKTGRTIEVERDGKKRRLGPVIDPVALIRSIEAGELSDLSREHTHN